MVIRSMGSASNIRAKPPRPRSYESFEFAQNRLRIERTDAVHHQVRNEIHQTPHPFGSLRHLRADRRQRRTRGVFLPKSIALSARYARARQV